MVLTAPYVSKRTLERRAVAAFRSARRQAGIDVNVSNVTVASHENGNDLRVNRFERDGGREDRRAARKRRRERALDRSRRAANPEQYWLSARQEKRAQRCAEAGLPIPDAIPKGPTQVSLRWQAAEALL